MRSLFVLSMVLLPFMAAANDAVVKKMAKETGLSEAEIRENSSGDCGRGTQLDMNICMQYLYFEADAKLNETYLDLLSRLKRKQDRDALKAAQRAWIKFRDAECNFTTGKWAGGSMRPTAVSSCRKTMTEARTNDLTQQLQCESPDCTAFNDGQGHP